MQWRRFLALGILVFALFMGTLLVMVAPRIRQCGQLSQDWPTQCRPWLDTAVPVLTQVSRITPKAEWVPLLPLYTNLRFLTDYWRYLLGYDQPITYLILLQNDTEMRANGGFFGSYAVVTITKAQMEVRFEDIYAPDGQLGTGHVEAPAPIEAAFRKGGYYLRDSDWDPDFVRGARTIRWFFDKGGEINPEVMVTINLSTIKRILQIVGPLVIADYNIELREETIFQTLQAKVETDFFPGSTQKKDILTGVGQALMAQVEHLSLGARVEIARILYEEMVHKNILVNTNNSALQNALEEKDFAGALRYPQCQGGESCTLDVFLAVEANLGANKANCCVERKTTHTVRREGDRLRHDVEIFYNNRSTEENPKLPYFFGGNYIQYVRLYIPKESLELQVTGAPSYPTSLDYYPTPYTNNQTGFDVSTDGSFSVLGFFHTTRAGSTSRITLSYQLPITHDNYELHILKQHGMQTSPQLIRLGEVGSDTQLADDYVFTTGIRQ